MVKNRLTRILSDALNSRRFAKAVATGDAARANKDWSAAYTAYRDAVSVSPAAAPIWVQLGHAAKEFGQLDAAEKAYETALRLTPDDTDVQIQLGHLFKETGQSAKALALYKSALSAGATDVHATDYLLRNALGHANKARENKLYRSAVHFLQQACALRADYDIYVQLGDCLREIGEENQARQAYYGALAVQPGDVDCLRRIEQFENTDIEPALSMSESEPSAVPVEALPRSPVVVQDTRDARFSENVAVILDRIKIAHSRRMA